VRTSESTHGREREHAGHACARRSGGFGARLPAWDALATLVVPLVALALTWSACSTTPSWGNLTRIWEPAGCLPDQPIHTGALIELRSGTPTGWAGSSYGAQSRTTWSYITAVACISAGIRTTSWL
jgi:hypothetical protein